MPQHLPCGVSGDVPLRISFLNSGIWKVSFIYHKAAIISLIGI
jgi:hypothetical protein